MFLPHEPADVGEKVTPARVVRIAVGVGKLVVHTVISAPNVDAVLAGNRLADAPEDSEWEAGVVGLVSPESMSSAPNCKPSPVPCSVVVRPSVSVNITSACKHLHSSKFLLKGGVFTDLILPDPCLPRDVVQVQESIDVDHVGCRKDQDVSPDEIKVTLADKIIKRLIAGSFGRHV